MSLGQFRILALTLPTVAALTVISILWFRHHQKKRRPRVDRSEPKVHTENFEDLSQTIGDKPDTCMSSEAIVQFALVSTENNKLEDKIDCGQLGTYEYYNFGVKEDITHHIVNSEELVNSNNIRESEEVHKISVASESEKIIKDTEETRAISVPSELVKSCNIDLNTNFDIVDKNNLTFMETSVSTVKEVYIGVEEGKILSLQSSLSDSKENSKPVFMQDQNSEVSVFKEEEERGLILKERVDDNEIYSDLEEGEIRSSDTSLTDSKGNSEESVFKRDSEDSAFKEEEEEGILGEIESDLEEGEIRSIDGRTEETMKKEQDQLAQKLASLEIDQMNKTSEQKILPSLELDQMKLDDGKSVSERDSANHSPSEVMLASPSISNFSDAHSEGSSDSGKGQSDVATSPSRTPAGGSSLAGDQAPAVYEFVLPQIIVGRLIGRHGTFLHEIKTQTHTNIFIKRHPDSSKLKICAIEGTQQDIDKALAKIRHKFPLRRFPQLTLEKVSFVHLGGLPPLKPEDFHLQLVEGVNNDVVLSSLISAAHFFLQQPCHPSYGSLAALNTIMSQLYSSGEAPVLEAPVNYAICAAPAMGGWYRAQIVHVDDDSETCTVRYLDYGGYSRVHSTELRQIRGDLLVLPFQAVECYLANVSPAGEEDWSEEARLFVQSLTCGQILQAQVYDYADNGVPLVYLYSSFGSQVVLINEELVLQGYAVIAECGSLSATASEDGGRTDDEGSRIEETCSTSKKGKAVTT